MEGAGFSENNPWTTQPQNNNNLRDPKDINGYIQVHFNCIP